tara:strand:+ start:191 stop:517 length:327 start_codon:yes stop_codon:yes gene_type:complete
MFRIKILFSIIIFSFLLFGTSIIKNETREIEKKISSIIDKNNFKSQDLVESQLDFSYLTSPAMIESLISQMDDQYITMHYSKIFLKMEDFLDIQNKIALQNKKNEKKK